MWKIFQLIFICPILPRLALSLIRFNGDYLSFSWGRKIQIFHHRVSPLIKDQGDPIDIPTVKRLNHKLHELHEKNVSP
jgi:hypothetical protein